TPLRHRILRARFQTGCEALSRCVRNPRGGDQSDSGSHPRESSVRRPLPTAGITRTRNYFCLVRASSSIRLARDGLKTPQEQNRVMYVTASSGVRRPSFTQSTIFLASEALTMPCPHMVASFSTSSL